MALRNALRQAEAAVEFYVGCCGGEDAAQRLVSDLEERVATAAAQVTRSRERVETLGMMQPDRPLPAPT